MANPQPNEYTRISNELYGAIMQSDFSKRQRNILDLIIRMSYGCGKKSALLRPSDFELVGVHKSDIKKELQHLEYAKVIFVDNESFEINLDYIRWRISLKKISNNYIAHREAVYKRDGYQCRYCGSKEDLTLDHIVPRSKGGSDGLSNLATACKSCNSRKRDKTLEQVGMKLRLLGGESVAES